MLIDRILQRLPEGTQISKPNSGKVSTLAEEEMAHGERAIAYRIPISKKPSVAGVIRYG